MSSVILFANAKNGQEEKMHIFSQTLKSSLQKVVSSASSRPDDKREAAFEAGRGLRPAGEGVRGEVGQQHAAAGGGREGAAPHRPQRRRQELQ